MISIMLIVRIIECDHPGIACNLANRQEPYDRKDHHDDEVYMESD